MQRARSRRARAFALRRGSAWLTCALCLSALWLSAPRRAIASDAAGRRVLLIEQGRDPFLERVGAEIEQLGFTLVRSDAQGALETSARAAQAVVAIRVLKGRKGVEVWMADATSGRSLLRQVVIDESPTGPDHELIALQTAELLRTSLLGERSSRAADAAHAQPAQPAVVASERRVATRTNTGVQLGLGALYSPGGASLSLELGLSLYRFFGESWGLALDLSMPLHAGEITEVEGSAKIGAYYAGALWLWRFQREASPWFALAGIGPALLLVTYEGETTEPLQASSGERLTAGAYLRGDAGIEAASWLRFGLRLLAGASAGRVSMTFAGNAAGSFGPSFFAGFALAEITLP